MSLSASHAHLIASWSLLPRAEAPQYPDESIKDLSDLPNLSLQSPELVTLARGLQAKGLYKLKVSELRSLGSAHVPAFRRGKKKADLCAQILQRVWDLEEEKTEGGNQEQVSSLGNMGLIKRAGRALDVPYASPDARQGQPLTAEKPPSEVLER